MKRPIFVRPLSDAERETLEAGLRSPDAFTLRRCQILLASGRGQNAYPRSPASWVATTRRRATPSTTSSTKRASRRRSERVQGVLHAVHAAFDIRRAEKLKQMLHQSPRNLGKDTSLWTLDLAALVSFEEGLAKERVSGETIRATLERMGVGWQRAKRWITSPAPGYARKKASRPADAPRGTQRGLSVGFRGRVLVEQGGPARPQKLLREGQAPARLVKQSLAKDDPDPKAISSCYGLHVPELQETWLRFVDGRPVSGISTQFLDWCSEKLEAAGTRRCGCWSGTTPAGT